jgi:CopG family transcriptional regulator/antitoxin EndoAI
LILIVPGPVASVDSNHNLQVFFHVIVGFSQPFVAFPRIIVDSNDFSRSGRDLTYTHPVCMMPSKSINKENPMTKRINIVLPEETIQVLDRVAPKGNRSRFISDAVVYFVTRQAKGNLEERLKQGAQANAQRDLEIAKEWFSLDEEAWQKKPSKHRKK